MLPASLRDARFASFFSFFSAAFSGFCLALFSCLSYKHEEKGAEQNEEGEEVSVAEGRGVCGGGGRVHTV